MSGQNAAVCPGTLLEMKEAPDHPANLDVLIQNFDCALSHPDANDLEKLKEAVMNPSF